MTYDYIITKPPLNEETLMHYGVQGMRWGHRKKYYNSDGSLNELGRKKIAKKYEKYAIRVSKKLNKKANKYASKAYNFERKAADEQVRALGRAKGNKNRNLEKERLKIYKNLPKRIEDRQKEYLYNSMKKDRNYKKTQKIINKYGANISQLALDNTTHMKEYEKKLKKKK